jgi:primosomal protein N' (replication factor Y)
VAVPVAVDRSFSYALPDGWVEPPAAGTRVLVPFGQRTLVGVVRPTAGETPPRGKVRALLDVLDESRHPTMADDVVKLCEWMQDYYVAPVGEVYRLALPGLLTGVDARTVTITDLGERVRNAVGPLLAGDVPQASPQEIRVLDAVAVGGARGLAVSKLSAVRPRVAGVFSLLADLERRGLCATSWEDASGAETRTETHYRRTDYLRGASADEQALQRLVGRSKQRRAILDYIDGREGDAWVSIGELRGPFPRARQLLSRLLEAGLVDEEERPRALVPFGVGTAEPSAPWPPTEEQAAALASLEEDLASDRFHSSLLHGITGSGKTEVYLRLIESVRSRGRAAIVLVPEIALTPQLADRFRARFADEVAVLHSGLTPRQRLDAWQQIRSGRRPIVIGARSAVFAPVPRLGAVIVDEEHDPSFKQEEGVRYNARDVAIVRAREVDALVVLGSATPALETYENARRGRHRWLRLSHRPTPRPLPEVELVPLSVHRPDPESMLTGRLKKALVEVAEAGQQAIVFLNRRGFTTTLVCTACGSLQQCPDCSAPSMTYHLGRNRLMCHLCGHIEAVPQHCRECGASDLIHGGAGTERVELALARELPGVSVLRLDRDTARGRQLLHTLARFRDGEADVLVGTQMLSKGHDFPRVTLVGILQADHGLGLPDPRAAERTFQLLTQVSGRAGRGDRPGRVIVQAFAVGHPAITFAARHDYAGFAEEELRRRSALGNPPFGRLALVRVHGPDANVVEERVRTLGREIGELCREVAAKHADEDRPPVEALGPVPSPIARINKRTRWQLLLRATVRSPLRWLLQRIRGSLGSVGSGRRETVALVDVDPQSLL